MKLFKRRKKEEIIKKENKSLKDRVNIYDVIRNPRATEKAANLSEDKVYVFDVSKSATKKDIADSVELIYNVKPKKIRVCKVSSKPKRRANGMYGLTKEGKKAYVYLDKKDSIKLI